MYQSHPLKDLQWEGKRLCQCHVELKDTLLEVELHYLKVVQHF